jgi:hypothetical protein
MCPAGTVQNYEQYARWEQIEAGGRTEEAPVRVMKTFYWSAEQTATNTSALHWRLSVKFRSLDYNLEGACRSLIPLTLSATLTFAQDLILYND